MSPSWWCPPVIGWKLDRLGWWSLIVGWSDTGRVLESWREHDTTTDDFLRGRHDHGDETA
jgi:hypothetical protein